MTKFEVVSLRLGGPTRGQPIKLSCDRSRILSFYVLSIKIFRGFSGKKTVVSLCCFLQVFCSAQYYLFMIRSGAGPQPTNNNGLVLIQARTRRNNGWSTGTAWAKRLGADTYQLKAPFHLIAGFNFDDVVRAQPVSGSPYPCVLEVVARSGYRTIHLAFDRFLPKSERTRILERLTDFNVEFEMMVELFYTLQIAPEADFNAICDYLKSLSSQNVVKYEPEVDLDVVLRFCFLQ